MKYRQVNNNVIFTSGLSIKYSSKIRNKIDTSTHGLCYEKISSLMYRELMVMDDIYYSLDK